MDVLNVVTNQIRLTAVQLVKLAPSLLVAGCIAALFVWSAAPVSRMVSHGIHRRIFKRASPNIIILVEKLFRVLYVALGLFLALSMVVPSLKMSDLFGVLGVGGVAVGFAFRDILQNFFAGVILLLSRTFEVGDRIVSGAVSGVVEEIQIRSTVVKTDSGDRVIIPNGLLVTRETTHRETVDRGKVEIVFFVPLESDLSAVLAAARQSLELVQGILKTPAASVVIDTMSERALTLKALLWIADETKTNAMKELFLLDLQQRLLDRQISFGTSGSSATVIPGLKLDPATKKRDTAADDIVLATGVAYEIEKARNARRSGPST